MGVYVLGSGESKRVGLDQEKGSVGEVGPHYDLSWSGILPTKALFEMQEMAGSLTLLCFV